MTDDPGTPPNPTGPWAPPPAYPTPQAPTPPPGTPPESRYGSPPPPPVRPTYGGGAQPPPPPPRRPLPVPERGRRRPEPRLGVSLAGVGVGVAVIGVILWGGDYLAGSGAGASGPSDSHRLLGIGLSLIVIAAGYALALVARTGPLATAGVTSSALGVPVLLGFATFDTGSSSGLPFSIDAVVLVSVAVWLVSFAVVPGVRGHVFYLGLASTLLWIYVIDKAEPSVLLPVRLLQSFLPRGLGIGVGGGPDWGTVSLLSFLFGLGYYAILTVLDRSGRHGTAVPFAVSGFIATAAGILAAAPDVHAKGTGTLLIIVGAALATLGALASRRFTTWVWAAAVGVGVVVLVVDSVSGNAAGGGIALIICGVALVLIGFGVARISGERADEASDA